MNRSGKLLSNVTKIASFMSTNKKLSTASALAFSKDILSKEYLWDFKLSAMVRDNLVTVSKSCEDKAAFAAEFIPWIVKSAADCLASRSEDNDTKLQLALFAPACAVELSSSMDEACKPFIDFIGKIGEEIELPSQVVTFLKACSSDTL